MPEPAPAVESAMPTARRPRRRGLRGAFASLLSHMREPEPAVGGAAATRPEAEELLRCPVCRDASLCPIDWERNGELAWWIHCRCGNCGAWVEAVVSNRQAAALDCALDRQRGVIRRAADQLELERTERVRGAGRFIAALQGDRIQPADFG